MKMLMESAEQFADAHPEDVRSGVILAKAGYNALIMGEFQKACNFLKKSLDLKWGDRNYLPARDPAFKKTDSEKSRQNTVKWVLSVLYEKTFASDVFSK